MVASCRPSSDLAIGEKDEIDASTAVNKNNSQTYKHPINIYKLYLTITLLSGHVWTLSIEFYRSMIGIQTFWCAQHQHFLYFSNLQQTSSPPAERAAQEIRTNLRLCLSSSLVQRQYQSIKQQHRKMLRSYASHCDMPRNTSQQQVLAELPKSHVEVARPLLELLNHSRSLWQRRHQRVYKQPF